MQAILPGLILASAMAAIAMGLTAFAGIPGSSPLIIAVVLGILFRATVGVPEKAKPGLTIASRQALRLGVALLGFQLTLGELMHMGGRGAAIATVVLFATLLFTRWLGRMMGLDKGLVMLIAAGTSICGASAIVGANAITRAPDSDVSYAVATVTVMGLVSMVLYPQVSMWIVLSSPDYGIWVGSSIHEVAQVVAAGFQRDAEAGEMATIVKLTRVLLLAPTLLLAWFIGSRGQTREGLKPSVPWFVVAFVLAAASNTLGILPAIVLDPLTAAVPFILTLGLAAVGVDTDARTLIRRGARPLLLAFLATAFIAALSLVLIASTS